MSDISNANGASRRGLLEAAAVAGIGFGRQQALIVHGSDDQIVPLDISAKLTARLVPHAKLVVYEGGSHGLLHVDKDRLNADLLAFLHG